MFEKAAERRGDCLILRLRGKLALAEIADLRKTFWQSLTQDGARKLVVDFSETDVLNSSSIALLVATKNLVAKKKAELVLTGVGGESYALLERANLHRYFDLRPTVENGLAERPPAQREEGADEDYEKPLISD